MSKTVTLDFPITVADRTITSLDFRRPVVDDLEKLEVVTNSISKVKKMIELIGSSVDHPDFPLTSKIIGKIDAADLSRIAEEIGDFLPRGRKAGESN